MTAWFTALSSATSIRNDFADFCHTGCANAETRADASLRKPSALRTAASKSSLSTGFDKYAATPNSLHRTESPGRPEEVTMTTALSRILGLLLTDFTKS